MRKVATCVAIVASLALVGCGAQGAQLDREVNIEGLTMSVPSGWVEDGEDYEYSSIDSRHGNRTYEAPDNSSESLDMIAVNYSTTSENDPETADEFMEEYYSEMYTYEKVKETVIDGSECTVYDVTMDGAGLDQAIALIYGRSMDYTIYVYGDEVSMDSILETVSIS